jgi:hypothetical protein
MTTQASAQPAATWDEDQNIAALAHLERMQEQVSRSPRRVSKLGTLLMLYVAG